MKVFIFKGLMGFLKMILIIFSVVKVVKCLILVGLLEVDIEVIFELIWGEMSRKRWFYKEFVDRTDVPVYLANKRSQNVNYAPIYTEQTFSNIP